MSLVKAYKTFMLDTNVAAQSFSTFESQDITDTTDFRCMARDDEKRGLVSIEKQDGGETLKIVKVNQFAHPATPTLDMGNESAKEVQKTKWRVDLDEMKKRIQTTEYIHPKAIPHMTIAIVIIDNGYALMGMSAPADPENFNETKGREFAFEDALRKLWPLEAYLMRERMTGK